MTKQIFGKWNPSRNFAKKKKSWEQHHNYSLGSLNNTQLLAQVSNTPVVGTPLEFIEQTTPKHGSRDALMKVGLRARNMQKPAMTSATYTRHERQAWGSAKDEGRCGLPTYGTSIGKGKGKLQLALWTPSDHMGVHSYSFVLQLVPRYSRSALRPGHITPTWNSSWDAPKRMGGPLKGRSGRFSWAKSVAPPVYRTPKQSIS